MKSSRLENFGYRVETIWKNPAEAVSALAKKESWLAALILIAAQALFSGLFALTNYGVGLEHNSAISLVISFFFTFFFSIALSAAAMGMYLGIGKARTQALLLNPHWQQHPFVVSYVCH